MNSPIAERIRHQAQVAKRNMAEGNLKQAREHINAIIVEAERIEALVNHPIVKDGK